MKFIEIYSQLNMPVYCEEIQDLFEEICTNLLEIVAEVNITHSLIKLAKTIVSTI